MPVKSMSKEIDLKYEKLKERAGGRERDWLTPDTVWFVIATLGHMLICRDWWISFEMNLIISSKYDQRTISINKVIHSSFTWSKHTNTNIETL